MKRSLMVIAALLAPSVAAAEAAFYVPLSDTTESRARTKIRAALAKEGKTEDLADLLLKLDAFASLNDSECPGFSVDVLNATKKTLWSITVTVAQESGVKKKTDVFHLPYLPANTQTTVNVSCLEDYSYSYSRYSSIYGNGDTTITVDPLSESPHDLKTAMQEMSTIKVDTTLTDASIEKGAGNGKTLLEAALAMNDNEIAKDLVAAISTTGIGAKELGDALATNEALADEVADSLTKLPPAQQAKLARALLGSSAAEAWVDKLTPVVDKLCAGAHTEVVALWAAAQGTKSIPVASLRDRVRAKCTLLPTDAAALVATLDASPAYAGDALDAADPAVFGAIVTKWKTIAKAKAKTDDDPFGPPPAMYAFLANTNDSKRFDQAIAVLPPEYAVDAIGEVAKGTPSIENSPASAHKIEWINTATTALHESAKDSLVRDLFGKLVDGGIKDPAMREGIANMRKFAPSAADAVVDEYTGRHSNVYDPAKLSEAGISSLDFLAFASTSLGDCTTNLDMLEACAAAVQKSKLPLVKAGSAALKSDFTSAMQHLVTMAPTKQAMVESAKKLSAAGWDVQFAVDNLCETARSAIQYNYGDFDEPMALVKELPGGDVCIASIADDAAKKKRNVLFMTIAAILGLVVPIPIGGFFIRRRWRKLQAAVPKDAVETAKTGRLDDRLGAAGLGRSLTGAIADAVRDTRLPGLAAVDAGVIDRIGATVKRSVKTGDAATTLMRANGHTLYVVALPVKHARPQLVARYLGSEWPDHVEAVRASSGGTITAIVVLCSPDATEATLLVGMNDGMTKSDPDALLDAKDARERNANTFRGVMTLAVAPQKSDATEAKAA